MTDKKQGNLPEFLEILELQEEPVGILYRELKNEISIGSPYSVSSPTSTHFLHPANIVLNIDL